MHHKLEFEEASLTQLSAKLKDFQTRVRDLEEGCRESQAVSKIKSANPGIKIDSRIWFDFRDQGAFSQTYQCSCAQYISNSRQVTI